MPCALVTNHNPEKKTGFDPIKESHKGLSELINDEVLQQQQMNSSNQQRSRMPPPPGFNHLQNSSFSNFSAPSPRTQSKCFDMLCINTFVPIYFHSFTRSF